jgi:hypothetical protein
LIYATLCPSFMVFQFPSFSTTVKVSTRFCPVLKQVDPRVDVIVAEVVYEGDTFKYQMVRGRKIVTEHEQSIDNVDKAKDTAILFFGFLFCRFFHHFMLQDFAHQYCVNRRCKYALGVTSGKGAD